MPRPQPMLMSVSNNKKEVLLQPSWLGKINWSNGIPTSPDKYMAAQAKIIDYWGEYRSPVWDDLYEYRKSFSTNNYNSYNSYDSYNNYENISDLQDKDNQFITISKNKRTIKQVKYSSSQLNYFSMNNGKEIDSAEISDSEYKNIDYDDVINDIQEDIPDIQEDINDINDTKEKDNYDYTEDNF
jgi:hypothetical protein